MAQQQQHRRLQLQMDLAQTRRTLPLVGVDDRMRARLSLVLSLGLLLTLALGTGPASGGNAAAAAAAGAGAGAGTVGTAETGWMIWTFGLFALALVVVALEVFLPSGGILGAVAFISAMAGVVFAFRGGGELAGLTALGIVLVSTPTVIWALIKVFPSTPVGSRIILSDNLSEAEVAARARERVEEASAFSALIGATGFAITSLRPGGTIRIDNEDVEAFAETGMIEPNTQVEVCRVVGRQIRVRPVTGAGAKGTSPGGPPHAHAHDEAADDDPLRLGGGGPASTT